MYITNLDMFLLQSRCQEVGPVFVWFLVHRAVIFTMNPDDIKVNHVAVGFQYISLSSKFGCSMFIVFRRWGERHNERVITVGIGCQWVLQASATSRFSG